jgi:2'-5' RNA ligase
VSNLVIVAIPDENDRVWKVSSEKVPHLTLLFLGDVEQVSNADKIVQFVQHAAEMTLNRFYLPVDRRGELGEDKADVLFFKRGRYDYKAVRDFRMQLLKNDAIRTAYDSTQQFEGPWNPHLTLGYPESPAKKDDTDRDFGFYDVSFTKIAVWMGDYEGPEFVLKDPWDEWETMEAAPVDAAWSADTAEEVLEHYGVKGMRWGHRKDLNEPYEGSVARGAFRRPAMQVIPKVSGGTATRLLLTGPIALKSSKVRDELKAADQAIEYENRDKKWEKQFKKNKRAVEVHNRMAEAFNKDIDARNKRYGNVDLKDPKNAEKAKSYADEVKKSLEDHYGKAAADVYGTSPSGNKSVTYDPATGLLKLKNTRPVAHADVETEDAPEILFFYAVRNNKGLVTDIQGLVPEIDDDELAQSAEDGAEFMVHTGAMDIDYFLEHFGVKGMRWGVRKEDLKSGAKTVGRALDKAATALADSNFEGKLNTDTGRAQVEAQIKTKAHEAFQRTDLPAIKNKTEYQEAKKLTNRLRHPKDPATKAYRKEVKEAYIKRLEDAANSMTNISGTRQYTIRERGWELPPEGGALPKSKYYWDVSTRTVKHADDTEATWTMEVVLDEDGFVTDINEVPAEDSMAQAMELGTAFLVASGLDLGLEHYGVKGMRWGVRRDSSGSTTRAAVAPVATSKVRAGNRIKTKIEVEGGQNHDAHPDALKVAEAKAKLKKSGVAALSNQELMEMQRRLNLEQQVKQLAAPSSVRTVKRIAGNQGQQTANQFISTQLKKKIAF